MPSCDPPARAVNHSTIFDKRNKCTGMCTFNRCDERYRCGNTDNLSGNTLCSDTWYKDRWIHRGCQEQLQPRTLIHHIAPAWNRIWYNQRLNLLLLDRIHPSHWSRRKISLITPRLLWVFCCVNQSSIRLTAIVFGVSLLWSSVSTFFFPFFPSVSCKRNNLYYHERETHQHWNKKKKTVLLG